MHCCEKPQFFRLLEIFPQTILCPITFPPAQLLSVQTQPVLTLFQFMLIALQAYNVSTGSYTVLKVFAHPHIVKIVFQVSLFLPFVQLCVTLFSDGLS